MRDKILTYEKYLLAAALGVCALWLALAGQSLRLDESQSLWQISHSTGYTLDLISRDVHVPLYHLLLKVWESIGGGLDVVWGRLLSLLFVLLSIPVMFLYGRRMAGERAGLYAALLTAFSPFVVWYSSELRMYTLLFFLVALQSYLFINHCGGKKTAANQLGLVVSTVLGVYTHYFFWLILAAEGLFLILKFRDYKSAFWRFCVLMVLALAALSPWIYLVLKKIGLNNASPNLLAPSVVDVFNSFLQFIFGFQDLSFQKLLLAFWPASLVVLFSGLAKEDGREKFFMSFPVLSVVVPLALALSVSWALRPVYSSRYLICVLPALLVILGWLLARMSASIQKFLLPAVVGICLAFCLAQTVLNGTPVKEDYAGALNIINQQATPEDVVYVSAPFTVYPVEYYYDSPARLATLPAWDRFTETNIPAFNLEALQAQIKNDQADRQSAWLLVSYDQGYQVQLADYFSRNFKLLESFNLPGSPMKLYHYALH